MDNDCHKTVPIFPESTFISGKMFGKPMTLWRYGTLLTSLSARNLTINVLCFFHKMLERKLNPIQFWLEIWKRILQQQNGDQTQRLQLDAVTCLETRHTNWDCYWLPDFCGKQKNGTSRIDSIRFRDESGICHSNLSFPNFIDFIGQESFSILCYGLLWLVSPFMRFQKIRSNSSHLSARILMLRSHPLSLSHKILFLTHRLFHAANIIVYIT